MHSPHSGASTLAGVVAAEPVDISSHVRVVLGIGGLLLSHFFKHILCYLGRVVHFRDVLLLLVKVVRELGGAKGPRRPRESS